MLLPTGAGVVTGFSGAGGVGLEPTGVVGLVDVGLLVSSGM